MDQTPSATLPPLPDTRRRRFTVAEYHRMAEAGILAPDERVELIEGDIVQMAPIGGPHIMAVIRLTRLLVRAVGDRAAVSVQSPVRLDDDSEPEPDLALLKPREDEADETTPRADEVLLLVEVADSSLRYDLRTKRPLYARSRIPELWIVDLDAGVVEVCRSPAAEDYAFVGTARPGQTLGIAALPEVAAVPVESIVRRHRS